MPHNKFNYTNVIIDNYIVFFFYSLIIYHSKIIFSFIKISIIYVYKYIFYVSLINKEKLKLIFCIKKKKIAL